MKAEMKSEHDDEHNHLLINNFCFVFVYLRFFFLLFGAIYPVGHFVCVYIASFIHSMWNVFVFFCSDNRFHSLKVRIKSLRAKITFDYDTIYKFYFYTLQICVSKNKKYDPI